MFAEIGQCFNDKQWIRQYIYEIDVDFKHTQTAMNNRWLADPSYTQYAQDIMPCPSDKRLRKFTHALVISNAETIDFRAIPGRPGVYAICKALSIRHA